MAIIKCKMCGGDLNIVDGQSVCECEYCGTRQTVPMLDDEKKMNLFSRANRLRFNSEFDKASGIYESIIADAPEEAEAYWGLVLCKYGIEYVDDPATGKKIPTCHRSSFDSVMQDSDFDLACEYADPIARKVYREEAKQIEEIRKGILEVSSKEEPYDIFICYKETDAEGNRTLDSVLAQDLYDTLTDKGYRTFFARISLEDKLGQKYEPYIFAALNSAKIMLAVGTDYDYYNAVWVKNEWSRYLKLMVKDKDKHLIPCYKNLDAYDMPQEFAKLQAQDLGKVGATQDLLRGIEKLLPREKMETQERVIVQQAGGIKLDALLKRGYMALEDKEWENADQFFEEVLNLSAECAEAYIGKLMAELRIGKKEDLKNQKEPFQNNSNYKKALRFADKKLKTELESIIEYIENRNEEVHLDGVYSQAQKIMNAGSSEADFLRAEELFRTVSQYKNAAEMAALCHEKTEKIRAEKQIIKEQEQWINKTDHDGKKKKTVSVVITILCIGIVVFIAARMIFIPQKKLRDANDLILSGEYEYALSILQQLGDYKNSEALVQEAEKGILYNKAIQLEKNGNYREAEKKFQNLEGFLDSAQHLDQCRKMLKSEEEKKTEQEKSESNLSMDLRSRYSSAESYYNQLSTGRENTIAIRSDGSVLITGSNAVGELNAGKWENIVSVSCGSGYDSHAHILGLQKDGKVVAAGLGHLGQCAVQNWENIVAVSAGGEHSVGLREDGTVVATGNNDYYMCNVNEWKNIKSVSANFRHTVGLVSDGTVVATGWNQYGECDVSEWKDIAAIATGGCHTVGLKNDGTVVAVGDNSCGQCDVSAWKEIVAISAYGSHTVGLKKDGTVVAVGYNENGECNVSSWKDIAAVSAGGGFTIGLKKDGTFVASGTNELGECDVSDWNIFQ